MISLVVRTVDFKQPLLSAQSMRTGAGVALPLGPGAQSRAQSAAQMQTERHFRAQYDGIYVAIKCVLT